MRKSNKGQGMMEYLILTALISILCLSAMKGLGNAMKTRINNTTKRLTKDIPSDLTSFGGGRGGSGGGLKDILGDIF